MAMVVSQGFDTVRAFNGLPASTKRLIVSFMYAPEPENAHVQVSSLQELSYQCRRRVYFAAHTMMRMRRAHANPRGQPYGWISPRTLRTIYEVTFRDARARFLVHYGYEPQSLRNLPGNRDTHDGSSGSDSSEGPPSLVGSDDSFDNATFNVDMDLIEEVD